MSRSSDTNLRALTTLVGVIATVLLGWVFTQAADILQPLVIAILLCNVLQPLVRTLGRIYIPAWVTVVLLTALLIMGLQQGGELLYDEVQAFVKDSGGLTKLKADFIEKLDSWSAPSTLVQYVQDLDMRGSLIGFVGTGGDFIRGTFLVILYMLFIFAEQAVFRRKLLAVASERFSNADELLSTIGLGIQRYLGVKTVTSLATGVLIYTLLVWLQVPYALLFGFITFLLNYIPTFGSIAASVPPIATALASFEGWGPALTVAVGYLVVNTVIGSIIDPKLLGRELNLSPLVVLVSVVVWAGMWGVPGMFLAVPLTATAQIVLANLEPTRPLAILLSNGPPSLLGRLSGDGGDDEEERDELERPAA